MSDRDFEHASRAAEILKQLLISQVAPAPVEAVTPETEDALALRTAIAILERFVRDGVVRGRRSTAAERHVERIKQEIENAEWGDKMEDVYRRAVNYRDHSYDARLREAKRAWGTYCNKHGIHRTGEKAVLPNGRTVRWLGPLEARLFLRPKPS